MKQKNLLYFSALIAVIALLSLLSGLVLDLVHGVSQTIFEGNSNGKTFVMLSWFFLMPLISFFFLKFNLTQKIKNNSKIFLFVFIAFAVLGYSLGLLQFSLISSEFSSWGPFATIAENNGVISWQASKLTHNHFPKASIYFLEKSLGLNFGGSFDDGFPWYSFIPNVELWSILFLLVEFAVLVSGILFINSKLKETSFFDFLVFVSGFLALLISVLDGGVASGAAMMAVFFIALYFSRNYLKTENHAVATLFPLLLIGFIGFADVVLPLEIGNNFYASSIILFFGLLYYFFNERKTGKLKLTPLNIVFALLLLSAFFISATEYLEFSFGREIQPGYFFFALEEKDSGGGIFVYGLPEKLSKEKVDLEVKKFGEIIKSDKSGWSYYALLKPERNFRTGELEFILKEKFNSSSYLYVEEVTPSKKINSYRILWFKEVNSEDFLSEEFLASKIINRTGFPEKNLTEIVVEEKTLYMWQMTSILSEIKSNGFEGKILLIKNS